MFEYSFSWDRIKEANNRSKHGVSFELAATVFKDRLARTIWDEEHSETGKRWVTLGQVRNGQLLVVIHTYDQISTNSAEVRIISARRPTKHERRQYETKI